MSHKPPTFSIDTLKHLLAEAPEFDVFLCHAGPVKQLAMLVCEELQRLGFSAFLDDLSLSPGDNLDARMKDAVTQAAVGIALFDLDSFQRPLPMTELPLIVDADLFLDTFKAAMFGGPSKASHLSEIDFEFLGVTGADDCKRRNILCFSVLRIYIEKYCCRLPAARVGDPYIIGKALKAVEATQRHAYLTNVTAKR
jgi:hypothetical protein